MVQPPQGYPPQWNPDPRWQQAQQQHLQKQQTAAKLVMWSHILGWGGLAFVFVGAIGLGILFQSPAAAGVGAGIGMLSAVVGAVIGQVGRAMQGRAI